MHMPLFPVFPVREMNPLRIFGKRFFYLIRPLDKDEISRIGEEFFKVKRRKIFDAIDPIGVHMHYKRS